MSGRFFSIGASLLLLAALLAGPVGVISANGDGPGKGGPSVPTAWTFGPNTTFPSPSGGLTRFDGEYYPPNGRVYFLGGREGGVTYPDIYYFDPATGAFVDTGADLLEPVSNYTIALLQDSTGLGLYVFGGFNSNAGMYTNAVQAYYPATNTVVNYASTDPWNGRTASNCLVFPGGVAVYANKAYVFGGYASTNAPCPQNEMSDQTWIFDPTAPAGSKWTNTNEPLSGTRAYIASAVVDGYVYAIGGDIVGTTALLEAVPVVERLNTANVAAGWDDAGVADLPLPSSGLPGCDESQAFGFNTNSPYTGMAGKIILAGCGQWNGSGTTALTDTFIYDVPTNTWQPWEFLNEARRNHAAAFIPFSQGTGTPGMWVFSGYDSGGANNTISTEYRTLPYAPTSVRLAEFSASSGEAERNWAEPVVWTALLAGLALMGLAFGLSRAQRRRA